MCVPCAHSQHCLSLSCWVGVSVCHCFVGWCGGDWHSLRRLKWQSQTFTCLTGSHLRLLTAWLGSPHWPLVRSPDYSKKEDFVSLLQKSICCFLSCSLGFAIDCFELVWTDFARFEKLCHLPESSLSRYCLGCFRRIPSLEFVSSSLVWPWP